MSHRVTGDLDAMNYVSNTPSPIHSLGRGRDPPLNFSELSLPTFEDVCLLDHPTLRFIPSKSRPAFAQALSLMLRSVILQNTEEAWFKLFMLPKCVLPSLRRKGLHDKPLPVDTLCNMWSDNNLGALWSANRNHPGGVSINHRTKVIDQAVSLGSGVGYFWHGGDVVIRHNRLRDEVFNLCRHAHLSAGAAALAAEAPVETYGNWGKEVHDTFSRLASYLAIHQSSPKSAVVAEIYGQLNIALKLHCLVGRQLRVSE
ncbi:hypothetical protein EMCRGX_G024140 [Ephydatia muelleri]